MQENFRQFLDRLRQTGDLVDLHQPVDIRHIATLVDQAKTALFFHKVIGYDMPVVSGIIRSRERAIMALGCETYREIEDKLQQAIERPIPPKYVKSSPTREVVLLDGDVDLYKLPIPMSSIYDGGPMITAGVVITRDPEFGINSGIYRFIVKEKNLTGIDIVTPNNMRMFAQRAYQQGRPLPISISIGTHPIEITGSGYRAPLGMDEMAIAGGLRGEPVELAPCQTIDLPYIAGCRDRAGGGDPLLDRLDPGRRGRFGEFTRLMGGLHWNPLVRVKAISMRRDAIYYNLHMPWENTGWRRHDTLCGDPPGAQDRGGHRQGHQRHARRLCVLARRDLDQEESRRKPRTLLLAALSVMDLKHVVVVDDDIDVFDPMDVEWAIATRGAGRPRHHDREQCARQAARSEPAAGIRRGADRRQGRHRRHHPGRHSEGALRAHHLCLCRTAPRSTTMWNPGNPDAGGQAVPTRRRSSRWRSRYWTPSLHAAALLHRHRRSGFAAFDFRTVAQALGHLHATEKLWQDARGRMCVRGSEFAAKPKG